MTRLLTRPVLGLCQLSSCNFRIGNLEPRCGRVQFCVLFSTCESGKSSSTSCSGEVPCTCKYNKTVHLSSHHATDRYNYMYVCMYMPAFNGIYYPRLLLTPIYSRPLYFSPPKRLRWLYYYPEPRRVSQCLVVASAAPGMTPDLPP